MPGPSGPVPGIGNGIRGPSVYRLAGIVSRGALGSRCKTARRSAIANERASGKRSAASLASAFMTTCSSSGQMAGLCTEGGTTGAVSTSAATSYGVGPSCGTFPVSSSYSTVPSE